MTEDLSGRLREVSRRLVARYGRPGRSAHGKGLSPALNLVLTILSQNTTDRNRDRAFDSLRARYPTVERIAAARAPEVVRAIRVAGLSQAKAKAILGSLRRIAREPGGYGMEFLARMPLSEARGWLTALPGVGVKTANIVLLFSFGREAFPVDTHILRVTKRLRLVPRGADLSRAALLLEPHVPAGEQVPLHLNLIRLGREICRPRNPSHRECPLLPVCPEGGDGEAGSRP